MQLSVLFNPRTLEASLAQVLALVERYSGPAVVLQRRFYKRQLSKCEYDFGIEAKPQLKLGEGMI